MKHFYTILFWEKGKWRNECVLYPTKKEAERRKRFILLNMVQKNTDEQGNLKCQHFQEHEVQIFKIGEKVIFKKEERA